MLPRGGTLLGTRRGSPYDHPGGTEGVVRTFEEMQLDALIVVGGNGSLTVAHDLYRDFNLPIIGRRCLNVPSLGTWKACCETRFGWPPVSCGLQRC